MREDVPSLLCKVALMIEGCLSPSRQRRMNAALLPLASTDCMDILECTVLAVHGDDCRIVVEVDLLTWAPVADSMSLACRVW